MAQESESAGLSSGGTLTYAGETYGVVVGVRVESGHYAQALGGAVLVDKLYGGGAQLVHILRSDVLELVARRENTPGKQPAGNIVLGTQHLQQAVLHGGDYVFGALQVGCPGNLAELAVGDNEVAEAELPTYVFAKFVGEGLGPLHQEADLHLLGHAAHAFLRRLHQDGHLWHLLAYEPA